MPCKNMRLDEESLRISEDGATIKKLDKKVRVLEAQLCALLSQIEEQEGKAFTFDTIQKASKNGKVDIVSFWAEHKKEDEKRIAKELTRFSEHEQEIIKKLLDK